MTFISTMYALMLATLVLTLGGILGWAGAHATVATECDRLGGFYVGGKTYVCAQKGAQP